MPKARRRSPERLNTFSDGVFAVLITVLVLDLRPPTVPTFDALISFWPMGLSYAVSYLFIAIVWTNHHHLMRYATEATPYLMWFNFAHLFSVSLLPLSTAWMAVSRLAPQPVAFYAAVFCLVNATYICLIYELIDRVPAADVSPNERRIMRFRSITTLCVFAAAAVVALKYPLVGLGMCISCRGRPSVPMDIRRLIREMSIANPLWGAPRIHGELLKLGINVGQTTVAKYMARRRRPPSQGWKTFLRNHADGIASMDLFVVPTISFRLLYGLLILRHGRRQLLWLGVTAHPSAE